MSKFTTKQDIDYTNLPSQVTINEVDLPIDVTIGLNGDKVIAESKILDGAYIFERVSRKPFEVNFEFTLRARNFDGKYIFPNGLAYDLFTEVWGIDEVVTVQNTFLNKLGINELIIKNIVFSTIRGNTNLPCSLKCWENYTNPNNQKNTLVIPVQPANSFTFRQ